MNGEVSFDSYLIDRNSLIIFLRVVLNREKHVNFLLNGLEQLPKGFTAFDANIPWLCYWILNSLDLLGEALPDSLIARYIIRFT